MSKEILSALSGILIIAAFVPLIISVVWRGYRPPRSSWIIWAVMDGIIMAGMWQSHTLNGQIIGANIGVWVAILAIFKYGTPGWTKSQILQIVLAGVGIVLWKVLGSSSIGILTGCGVLFLGAWETFVDAWRNPDGQKDTLSRVAWTLFWLSCIPGTLSVSNWTLNEAGQPLMFLFIESTMMYLIFVRPMFLKK